MQGLENELSSGKILNQPSDNPTAVSQDMSIRQVLTETSGYQSTISSGLSWMKNTSGAIQNIISALQAIQTDVTAGLNGSNQSSGSFQALAADVQQIEAGINQTLDTKQGSRYLFGGTQSFGSSGSPASPSAAVQSGTATGGAINYQVSQNISIQVNVTAVSIMLTPPSGSNNLKQTLSNIIQHLQSGNAAALSGDLSDLESNLNQVTNLNAGLGATIRQATALQSQLNQYATTMSNEKGVIEGADMAKVITQFQTDQTVYTAALKMGAQLLLPSLVNYLPNG